MGYMRHHAILVTSENMKLLRQAKKIASLCFEESMISNYTGAAINGFRSFFVAPDGSKEGWDESNYFDRRRQKFCKRIDELAYEDGSNSVSYAEVMFGDDEGEASVVRHN